MRRRISMAARMIVETCEPRLLLATWTIPSLTVSNDTVTIARTGAGAYNAIVNGVSFTQLGVTAIVVNAGDGADTVALSSSDVPVTINGGNGNDQLDIAKATFDFRNVTGAVTFNGDSNGTTSGDYALVWGAFISTGVNVNITATQVTATGFGGLTYATDERLLLSLGGGDDVVQVTGTGATVQTSLYTNDGADTAQIGFGAYRLSAINYPIYFDGGTNPTSGPSAARGDWLLAYDQDNTTAASYSFDGATLRTGVVPREIVTTNLVETVDLYGSEDQSNFNLTALPATVAFTFYGENGPDTLTVANSPSIVGAVTLIPGNGSDQIRFDDSTVTTGATPRWRTTLIAGSPSTLRVDNQFAPLHHMEIVGPAAEDALTFASSDVLGAWLQILDTLPMPLTYSGGATGDILEVYERDHIAYPIQFNGAGGANSYSSSPTQPNYGVLQTLRTNQAVMLGAAPINFSNVSSLSPHGGWIHVESLLATQTALFNTAFEVRLDLSSTFNLLSTILGNVKVYTHATSALDSYPISINVNDFNNNSNAAYPVSLTSYSSSAEEYDQTKSLAFPGGGSLTWDVAAITLNLGGGNNTIDIPLTRVGETYQINSGGGNDRVTLHDVDTTTLNGYWRQFEYLNGLTLNGGAGADTLVLDDSLSTLNPAYSLDAVGADTRIRRTHEVDAFHGAPRPMPIALMMTGVSAIDLLEIRTEYSAGAGEGAPAGGNVIVNAPTVPLHIIGGSGPDNVLVTNTAADVVLNGGGGIDTLSVQGSSGNAVSVRGDAGDDVLIVNTDAVGTARVQLDTLDRWGSLAIGTGGGATYASGGLVPTFKQLNLSGNAFVDVNDGGLILDYQGQTPLPAIGASVMTGRANGNWLGSGIRSSAAAQTPGHAIGFGEAAELRPSLPSLFEGQPVDATSILLRYTVAGDATLDRVVNFDDLLIVAQNYGQTGRQYSQGNFDYSADGLVSFDDLLILAQNYNATLVASLTTPMSALAKSRRASNSSKVLG